MTDGQGCGILCTVRERSKGYENAENEQMKNHGYGMEDAMTVLEVLLKL